MGLDIFVRKGKRKLTDDCSISEAYDEFADAKLAEYKEKLDKWLKSVKRYKTEESAVKAFYNNLMEKYDASSFRYSIGKVSDYSTPLTLDIIKTYIKNVLSGKLKVFSEADLYFRKVNLLYDFFPPTEEESAYIFKDDIERLLDACDRVLALDKKDIEEAEFILPTCSGFFFGSTDYDDWYIANVKSVKKGFQKLLKDWDEDDIAIIHYWW